MSWTTLRLSRDEANDLSAITCPAAGVCYAVGTDRKGDGVLLSTTDSGRTWRAMHGAVYPGSPIACPTVRICYGGVLTTQGGRALRLEPVDAPLSPNGAGLTPTGVACPTVRVCYVSGAGDLQEDGSEDGGISGTTDGGRSWRDLGHNVPSYLDGRNAIACSGPRTCVTGGNFSIAGSGNGDDVAVTRIDRTADGGKTWQVWEGGGINLFGLACPTARACIAVGGTYTYKQSAPIPEFTTILTSHDGGASWVEVVPLPVDSRALNAVACRDGRRCIAVGNAGTILSTTDGGATWRQESSGTTKDLRSVAVTPDGSWYAVGAAGTLLRRR